MSGRRTTTSDILSHFEARRDELVADLIDLVRRDTPSGDPARVRDFARRYARLLEETGLRLEERDGPAGPHLFGERPGTDPPVVLVGHSDTVWPEGETARRPPAEKEGRLHGPGVYDMKGGLGLILWSLRYLAEADVPYGRRVLVFISADEERGSLTARPHMDELLPRDATAMVPEPPCPDGSLKIARKGVGIFYIDVEGRESHAGADPESGVSAVMEAARLALEVDSFTDPERGILVNVGTFEGGTATNVVAGSARLGIDLRYDKQEDGEAIERRIRSLRPSHAEARLTVTGGLEFPPLVPTEQSLRLSRRAIEIAREAGLEISAGSSGGGSDGSHLSARGLTVLDGLGIDGAGAHSLGEHIVIDRIPARAALFTRLLIELGEFPERGRST